MSCKCRGCVTSEESMDLKDQIVRAAVAWERARAEKVAPHEYRDLGQEETALSEAVRAYTGSLLDADTLPKPETYKITVSGVAPVEGAAFPGLGPSR